jgi:hypothetical protein
MPRLDRLGIHGGREKNRFFLILEDRRSQRDPPLADETVRGNDRQR